MPSAGAVGPYELLVSTSPDRSGPSALAGATVSGTIYAFTSPDTSDIDVVRFFLDDPGMTGSPWRSEGNAPYDFNGGTVASARGFNTGALPDGPHTITAALVLTNGTTEVVHATFTVANSTATPALSFSPGSVSFAADEGGAASSKSTSLAASDSSAASYTLSENAAWLSVSPTPGSTPADVTVTADPAGLAPGTYTADVTASASGYTSGKVTVSLAVAGAGGGGSGSAYSVLASTASNRSSPAALDGSTVAGAIYPLLSPETGVSQVRFFLDDPAVTGTPHRTENQAPWDYNGGSASAANPFDTTPLADGEHTITAAVDKTAGGTDLVHAVFTLANTPGGGGGGGDTTAPAAPTGLTATASSGEIALDWDDNGESDLDGYDVYRSASASGPFSKLNSSLLGASAYNDTTAPAGETSYYQVRAVDTSGNPSEPSNTANATRPAPSRAYSVLLSTSPDRSSPAALDGSTVAGTIYPFLSPETGVSQVRFFLDDPAMTGTPHRTENQAPWDYNGGSASAANPFDTTPLADGEHTITAAVDKTAGGTDLVHAVFTVANTPGGGGGSTPALSFSPGSLSFAADEGGAASSKSTSLAASDSSAASYTLSENAAWLSVSPTPGSTPADITVTADPVGLAPGTYTATVTASAPGYTSADLSVTLTVASTSGGDCSPVACEEILVRDLPYTLDFSSDHGKIQDKDGQGTGFTYVDPPSKGTGYVPANLDLDTASPGTLEIATTAGLASNAVDSQDNTLTVGIDAPSQISVLSTTLLSPPTGTGNFEQAGLWFGVDEDNYVKLVVISTKNSSGTVQTKIQALMEVNGAKSASKNSSALSGLSSSNVQLVLRADPSDLTIEASYSVNGASPVTLTTFNAPGEFFSFDAAGIDPRIGTRSFGGIFASHRKGANPLTYTFDDFVLSADEAPPPPPPPPPSGGGATVAFSRTTVSTAVDFPTSMAWGPDGRLYVSEMFGELHALTLGPDKKVTSDQVITTLGSRLTLGITIDPLSTPSNVILWVSHSSPSVDNGELNSSTITRLSGANFGTRQDVVTGLPRAIANHAVNSIHFGPDGKLYIAQGGNTGAGAPNTASTEFGDMEEQPLSAAILVVDVRDPDLDGTCAQPRRSFGPPPCDVQTYATGLRNPYDFVWHSNGTMYAPDNGLGVKGTYPPKPQPDCTGLANVSTNDPGGQPDIFLRIQPGKYYGHPNPYRNECVFKDGSWQGVAPLPNYVPPIHNLGNHRSANGTIEYRSDVFGGSLKGEVLIVNFSNGDNISRLALSGDGKSVTNASILAVPRLTGETTDFQNPLTLAEGPDGTIYVGEHGGDRITALVPSNSGGWTSRQAMPEAILDAGGTALGGKLYSVAGKASDGHRSGLRIYDPATNAWSSGPDLPGPAVENPAVAPLGGKLYVFGGSTAPFSGAVTNAAVYDPGTNQWTPLAAMPVARGGATAQALGGKIYVVGGMDGSGASLASVSVYDPGGDSWSSAADLGTRRDNPGSAVLTDADGQQKLYVFGGRTRNADGSSPNATLASVEMYDPATNSWTGRAAMPTGRRTMVVGLLNGRAQVMGGEKSTTTSGTFSQNEEYEPKSNSWRSLAPMPTPRHGAVAGTISGVVYVAGGGPTDGTSFSTVNEAFAFS